MAKFGLDDLVAALRECAGEDETVDLDGDIRDVPFDTLGYDSLALFNTVSQVEREHAISLPDDVVSTVKTPGMLLDLINEALAQPA